MIREALARAIFKRPSSIMVAITLMISACSPGFEVDPSLIVANQTGFTGPDGKNHTGASSDSELEKIKAALASDANDPQSVPKENLSLASRVLFASIESTSGKAGETAGTRTVQMLIRDAGRLSFTFKNTDLSSDAAAGSATNDVRYKFVPGRLASGEIVGFEAALLCKKTATEDCGVATVSLRELSPQSKKILGRAGLLLRHQDVLVLSKATAATSTKSHPTLKRLLESLKAQKPGKLQTFEVAWGPSGFSLDVGDSEICPSGRLVETNELDEPVKLNCPTVPLIRDLEGVMLGNTTRGELFIEISAKVQNLFLESTQSIYLLVRKKPGTDPSSPPDAEDDEPTFNDEAPKVKPTAPPTNVRRSDWLVPLDFNHAVTKAWDSDRNHPVIQKGVDVWKNSTRLKRFAARFFPNRSLVLGKLAENQVPNEFALITFIESDFFIGDGYPVQTSSAAAVGPWQFMPGTGKGNGLNVLPRVKVDKKWMVNPCDERADLTKSSEAAGRYLKSIMKMFPQDPKLVLMGYNQGEFGVQKNITALKKSTSETRLKVVQDVGLSYWALRKFNMAPAETLKYVEKFVSAYHAALESEPVAADSSIAAWRPTGECKN